MNLPNVLTLLRLLMAPVLAVLIYFDTPAGRYLVLFIVIFSELTDMLDGHYARKHNKVTDFGKLLDPMTDSIYRDTMFLSWAMVGQVHFFLVLPILYRDSIISTLRTFCAYKGIVVAARFWGKVKAIIQAVVIFTIIILRIAELHWPQLSASLWITTNTLMAIVCFITLYSAFDYIKKFIPELRNQK